MTDAPTPQPNLTVSFRRKELMPDGSVGCLEISAKVDNHADATCQIRLTLAQARALAGQIYERVKPV